MLINDNSFAIICELFINDFPLRKPAHYLMNNRTDVSQLYIEISLINNMRFDDDVFACTRIDTIPTGVKTISTE